METLKVSFFSFISLNLITKDILDFLTATVVYAQGALQKKQLRASFIDHFKKIIKIRHVYFQFYNPKLWSEKYFVPSVNSTVLVQIALQKKQMVDFLVEHWDKHFDENTIWIDFQFHNPKCQESCFHTLYARQCYLKGSYERSN